MQTYRKHEMMRSLDYNAAVQLAIGVAHGVHSFNGWMQLVHSAITNDALAPFASYNRPSPASNWNVTREV